MSAWLSALHGVNALALIGLTVYLTATNWAFRASTRQGTVQV